MRKIVFMGVFAVFVLLGIFVYQYFSFSDGRLHVIFCNVGQGDGVIVKEPGGGIFLIDSGPDEQMLSCLERNMPFWTRRIQIAFLSHPHLDHFAGYLSILRRYKVESFVIEKLVNKTSAYTSLMDFVKKNNIYVHSSYVGDAYSVKSGVKFKILGPSKEYLEKTSPNGEIGESGEFANLIMVLEYKDFDILFTGDSQASGLLEALYRSKQGAIDVMQIPHHGSRSGLNEEVLVHIQPRVGIISVGKNNYGHPSSEIIGLLKKLRVKYFRTDQYGDIEIVSDGKSFWVENS